MYNISKVAKGEILLFFNETFDALSKVCIRGPDVVGKCTGTNSVFLVGFGFRAFSEEWR